MKGEFPTKANRALADAARAVVMAFETDLRALPPHQRVSLQMLEMALALADDDRRLAGLPAACVPTPAAQTPPAPLFPVGRP